MVRAQFKGQASEGQSGDEVMRIGLKVFMFPIIMTAP